MQNTPQTKMQNISLEDLLNMTKFKEWIRNHINIYNKKEIPANHIFSFIDYIEKEVEAPDFKYDRSSWLDALNSLKETVSKNDRFKKRHSEDSKEIS